MPHSKVATSGNIFAWIRGSHLSLICVLLLIPVIPLMGCYGQFALTKAVYQWNGDVSDNGALQSLVLWVLSFIFVYSIAIVGDVVIFNLVEFWTGDNPALTAMTTESPDGTRVVMTPSTDGKTVRLDVQKDGTVIETREVMKTDDSHFEVRDAQGQLVGNIEKRPDGSLELGRPGTKEKAILTKEMLSQLHTQPAPAL